GPALVLVYDGRSSQGVLRWRDQLAFHGAGQRQRRQRRPGGVRWLWRAHRRRPGTAATGGAAGGRRAVLVRPAGGAFVPYSLRPLEGPHPHLSASPQDLALLSQPSSYRPVYLLGWLPRPARRGPGAFL